MNKTISKQNIEIREARKADIPFLIALIDGVFQEYGFINNALDELPDFFDFEDTYLHTDNVLFVLTENGKICGCGGLKYNKDKNPLLSRIYIDVNHRRKGYGVKIVTHLVALVKELGFPKVFLWTDTRFLMAHALYEKLGFIRTGRQRPLNDVNQSLEFEYEKLLID